MAGHWWQCNVCEGLILIVIGICITFSYYKIVLRLGTQYKMTHELLGNHKPSPEWYTPDHIWDKIFNVLGDSVFDVCPAMPISTIENGLVLDWAKHRFIYCNPPTPAAPWAAKALLTVKESKDTAIIFAAFSEAVLWQVNELQDYPVCWVRIRTNWIDGNKWKKVKDLHNDAFMLSKGCEKIGDDWYIENPMYLQPSKSPRNYNAFILLYQKDCTDKSKGELRKRFAQQFSDLGIIQLSRQVYKPC